MPELPDVQVFKEYVDATALHRRVDGVDVDRGPELAEDDPKTLISGLRGGELSTTRRHGFHDGWHLAYRCPRRLEEIGLVDDPDSLVRDRGLGPDPWPDDFDLDALRGRLEPRRGRIKTTLMNQEVLAGLGNIYVDEILFHAGIAPETKVPDLGAEAPARLFDAMKRILRRAVDARVDPERMPADWLLTRREDGASCPLCDGTIRKKKVGGRSTYLCASHQQR